MFPRLLSFFEGGAPRSVPALRSSGHVPVLFEPGRGLVAGERGERRIVLANGEMRIDGEIDWSSGDRALHAMGYLACLDDAEVVSLVDSWIAADRGARDDDATAARCVAWMREISARGNALPRDFVARASRSIAEQIRTLDGTRSDLGGLKALIFAGRFFSGPEADRWTSAGVDGLRDHLGVDVDRRLEAFRDLLECRAVVARKDLADALDAIAQAAVDLATGAPPVECLRVHGALGGRVPTARGAFDYGSDGRFGLRGDEALVVVRDGSLHWSLGGMPFVLAEGSERWAFEDVDVREDRLSLTSRFGDRRRSVRARLDRIEIVEELGGGRAGSLRTELRLHPAVDVRTAPDARSAVLVRKGVCALLESPSPLRLADEGDGERRIVIHHGIAPCDGEVSLRHVLRADGADLDAVKGLADLARQRARTTSRSSISLAPPPSDGSWAASASPQARTP